MSEFTKTVVNIVTGQTVTVAMTDAEIAEIEARRAAHAAEQAAAQAKAEAEKAAQDAIAAKISANRVDEKELVDVFPDERQRKWALGMMAEIAHLRSLLGLKSPELPEAR